LDKAPDAFRTISEVAEDLDIPQHVLRFWESRFGQIKPMKRAGGRRYYRPDDVDLLRGIRHLLYGEGYTIRGVQRILKEQGARFVQGVWQPGAEQPEPEPSDGVDEEAPQTDEVEAREAIAAPTGMTRPAVALASEPGLSRDDVRMLQGALHELSECRRLLDAALADEAR
jgi:DNA-binding transcriptional MerR regulator